MGGETVASLGRRYPHHRCDPSAIERQNMQDGFVSKIREYERGKRNKEKRDTKRARKKEKESYRECVSARKRERKKGSVCVCLRERKKRDRECVHMRAIEREGKIPLEYVCVCL
jgi:hypothetical protein